MAFFPPSFNALADCWFDRHLPADQDPDAENLTVQLYINPKAPFSLFDSFDGIFDWPATFVRVPKEALATWKLTQILEIPPETGQYYRASWKDVMHLGFPNEYLVISVAQCDNRGVLLTRYVTRGSLIHLGEGDPPMPVEVEPSGSGTGGTGGGTVHSGGGELGIGIAIASVGNGTQS